MPVIGYSTGHTKQICLHMASGSHFEMTFQLVVCRFHVRPGKLKVGVIKVNRRWHVLNYVCDQTASHAHKPNEFNQSFKIRASQFSLCEPETYLPCIRERDLPDIVFQ